MGVAAFTLFGAFGNAFGRALAECSKYPADPGCHDHPEYYMPAGVAASSAIYGFWAVHHCNQQLDAMHEQYLATHPQEIPMPAEPR